MFSEMLELYFKIVAVLVLIGLVVALGLGFAVGYWVASGSNEDPIVTSEPIEVEFGSSAPVEGWAQFTTNMNAIATGSRSWALLGALACRSTGRAQRTKTGQLPAMFAALFCRV